MQLHPSSRIRVVARILAPAALVLGAGLLFAASTLRALERLPEVDVSPVVLVASDDVDPETGSGGAQAPGWIEPFPFPIEVNPLRDGVVAEVLVVESADVRAGDLLATLDRRREELALAEARAQLEVARAALAAREAELAGALRERTLASVATSRVVEAQATLAEAEMLAARLDAEIAEARALRAEAEDQHRRKSALLGSGGASEGEVRGLSLRMEALSARIGSLEVERPARERSRAAARAGLEVAETARRELVAETTRVELAASARDEARAEVEAWTARAALAALDLDRSEVRAPCDGVVLSRAVHPGALARSASHGAFELYDPRRLAVRCDVPMRDVAQLRPGLAAEVRIDALPDRVFAASIDRIAPRADREKNTLGCWVVIDDPDPTMRPEMIARVRFLPEDGPTRGERPAVPREALRSGSGTSSAAEVLVAQPDGDAARAIARAIALGRDRGDGWIEVREGLAAGDRVVVGGAIGPGGRFIPRETAVGRGP